MKDLAPITLPELAEYPLCSILLTSYNYEAYIGEAIESILSQTYTHFEIVVCDDGSADGSRDIIRSYLADYPVTLIEKENAGQASALNEAFAKAKGEIICLLDSDDAFLPRKMASVVKAFQHQQDYGFCIHRMQPIDHRGNILDVPIPRKLAENWVAPRALRNGGGTGYPTTAGLSFRRPVAETIFPIPSHLFRSPDGYLARSASFITKIIAIQQPLVLYRIHGENLGAAARPSIQFISDALEDFHRNFDAVKDFLKEQYGQEIANQLQAEDRETYWEYLLALHVLKSDRSRTILGLPVSTILGHIHSYRHKLIWRVILTLPSAIGKVIFRLWWGKSAFKKYFNMIRAYLVRIIL
jgi:glycosyltransferase involved in cell wall biosynthesis